MVNQETLVAHEKEHLLSFERSVDEWERIFTLFVIYSDSALRTFTYVWFWLQPLPRYEQYADSIPQSMCYLLSLCIFLMFNLHILPNAIGSTVSSFWEVIYIFGLAPCLFCMDQLTSLFDILTVSGFIPSLVPLISMTMVFTTTV